MLGDGANQVVAAEMSERDYRAQPDTAVFNKISGGTQNGPLFQGRDFTVHLPPEARPALDGLPAPRSETFTGRSAELKTLIQALDPSTEQPVERISVVAGMAGVGKTELVLQVAAQATKQRGWFPGGVLFIDLFGYDAERCLSPERALGALLGALGIPGESIPPELQDRARLYRSVLSGYGDRGKRILVVLDNASSADQVLPLLPADGAISALVTSRHTLSVGGRIHELAILEPAESVELIHQALRLARGASDTRVDDERDQAELIAGFCGHLPLALQIVAALLADAPTRPLSSLVRALAAEHTRLSRLAREERAVRAAFELSYQLLSPQQALLFRLLPLNPGPDLSSDAAAYLFKNPNENTDVLLEDLARAHLIEPGHVWGRWRMHDLVRLYADEKGRAHSEDDQREDSLYVLMFWFLRTVDSANSHLRRPRQEESSDRIAALKWLEDERANLVAAAVSPHEFGPLLANSLGEFFHQRRYFDDWVAVSSAAVTADTRGLDSSGSFDGWALSNLALVYHHVRRFDDAIETSQRALAVFRECDDRGGELAALNTYGMACEDLGRHKEAVEASLQVVKLCRELGEQRHLAGALGNLAKAMQSVDLTLATEIHQQSVGACQESGDHHSEAAMRNLFGTALREGGQFEAAAEEHRRSIALYRETRDRHGEGAAWGSLGLALQGLRRFDEAIDAHRQDVTACEETDDLHARAQALNNLALALRTACCLDESVEIYEEAASLFAETGDLRSQGMAYGGRGSALQEAGHLSKAITSYERAVNLSRESGDLPSTITGLRCLAHALWEAGCLPEAESTHRQAVGLQRNLEA
ncbi:ATP-binding protein [Streptomyces sp. NPDC059373]